MEHLRSTELRYVFFSDQDMTPRLMFLLGMDRIILGHHIAQKIGPTDST